jgi:hypothetical protein
VIAIRWSLVTALVTFVICAVASASIPLWLASVLLLVAVAWSFGLLRRSAWVADIPAGHPDALGSLDLAERQHQPWRQPPSN